jgi:tetratricopeptide (TPR) repeat protein
MQKIKIFFVLIVLFFCQGEVFVIDPVKNANWHNDWGLYFMSLGYYDAAINEFRLAITLNHSTEASSTFYNNLGLTYFKLGDYKNAEKSFESAIKFRSNYLEYYESLAKTYKAKNTVKSMVSKYENSFRKDNYDSRSCLMLGLLNKNYGNIDLADRYLREFLRLEPDLEITRQVEVILKDLGK